MTNPNIPPSDEGARHMGVELMIAGNWDTRFAANAVNVRGLGVAIEAAADPDILLNLIEMRGEALVKIIGSGALSLFKRAVTAEREGFEAEFGNC